MNVRTVARKCLTNVLRTGLIVKVATVGVGCAKKMTNAESLKRYEYEIHSKNNLICDVSASVDFDLPNRHGNG